MNSSSPRHVLLRSPELLWGAGIVLALVLILVGMLDPTRALHFAALALLPLALAVGSLVLLRGRPGAWGVYVRSGTSMVVALIAIFLLFAELVGGIEATLYAIGYYLLLATGFAAAGPVTILWPRGRGRLGTLGLLLATATAVALSSWVIVTEYDGILF